MHGCMHPLVARLRESVGLTRTSGNVVTSFVVHFLDVAQADPAASASATGTEPKKRFKAANCANMQLNCAKHGMRATLSELLHEALKAVFANKMTEA